jgi:plastocyanin
MRLTTTLAATALATAAIFAAGCGSDYNKSDNSAAPAGKAEPTATTGDTTAGAGVAIGMKDLKFDPVDKTVKVGEKVTWTNDDSFPHNVTASDSFGEGGTYDFTPTKAGTIKYTCTLHSGMNGTLEVTN